MAELMITDVEVSVITWETNKYMPRGLIGLRDLIAQVYNPVKTPEVYDSPEYYWVGVVDESEMTESDLKVLELALTDCIYPGWLRSVLKDLVRRGHLGTAIYVVCFSSYE